MKNLITSDDLRPVLLTGSAALRAQASRAAARASYDAGCPVFAADCGGSLVSLTDEGYTCTLWDVYARTGLPLRTTVSELGPDLLAALMDLSDAQADLLQILIRIADEEGLLLIDTKDLRALISEVTGHRDVYEKTYGTINPRTASGLLSAVTLLEERGGADCLFEPAIDVRDFIGEGSLPVMAGEQSEGAQSGPSEERVGEGFPRIHILDARDITQDASLYAVFLLYLISECAENYPEADEGGDAASPVLTMILDEAQLLFSGSTRAFAGRLRRLTDALSARGVRLILLASDAKKIPEAAADLLRQVQIADLSLPEEETAHKSYSDTARLALTEDDPLHEKYKIPFDRDSAYEFLLRRGVPEEQAAAAAEQAAAAEGQEAGQQTAAEQAEAEQTGTEQAAAAGLAEQAEAGQAAAAEGTTAAGQQTAAEQAEAEQTGTEEAAAAEQAAAAEEVTAAAAEEVTTAETEEIAAGKSASRDTSNILKKAKSSAQSLGNTVAGTVGRQIGKSIGSNFGSFGSTLGGNVGASIGRGIMKTFFGE